MKRLCACLCAALFGAHFSGAAHAADIAVALTDDLVRVDAGFAGARLTLFGAVTNVENPADKVDIITVIRGPATRFEIRRLERRNLIWTPGPPHAIDNAPGLYLTTATKPISDIAPLPDQAFYRLGADYLLDEASSPEAREDARDETRLFADAFVTEVEDKGLYQDRVGGVSFKKGALFAVTVDLPANTPVGEYDVSVFLYQDGVLLGRDDAKLLVNKVGMERQIYDLAHQRPVSYGVICVALSLFAGWIAALAFRK